MESVWVPIIVAIIMSTPLYGLIKSIIRFIRGKDEKETNAWSQRDVQRRRADALHEALMRHRSTCYKMHGMPHEEMEPFPRRDKDY